MRRRSPSLRYDLLHWLREVDAVLRIIEEVERSPRLLQSSERKAVLNIISTVQDLIVAAYFLEGHRVEEKEIDIHTFRLMEHVNVALAELGLWPKYKRSQQLMSVRNKLEGLVNVIDSRHLNQYTLKFLLGFFTHLKEDLRKALKM